MTELSVYEELKIAALKRRCPLVDIEAKHRACHWLIVGWIDGERRVQADRITLVGAIEAFSCAYGIAENYGLLKQKAAAI